MSRCARRWVYLLALAVVSPGCNTASSGATSEATAPDAAAEAAPAPAPESEAEAEPGEAEPGEAEPAPAAAPADSPNPRHSLRPGDECMAFDLMTSRSKLPAEQREALVSWYRGQIRTLKRFAVLAPEVQQKLLEDSGTLVAGEINQRAADDMVGFAGVKCHITGGVLVNASGQIEATLVLDDVSPGTVAVSMQKGTAADSSTAAIQAMLGELIAKFEDAANDRVITQ